MNKEKWKIKKLGEVCEIVSGSTPRTNVAEYWENGTLKWITPAEINSNAKYIFETERHITQKAVSDTKLKPFPKNTVILTSRAPIGKVAIAGDEMFCNQGFKNLVCDSQFISPFFLYYFLKGNTEYLNTLGRGATFKEISKQIVANVKINLPPLPVQEKIVSELDTLHRLKELQEQQLAELDNLAQSTFYSMFGDPIENEKGWEVKRLGEVCEINPKKSEIKDMDSDTEVSFVPMANVGENGVLTLIEDRKIKDVWSGFTYFRDNDVLFAKITPCMENGKRTIAKNLKNAIGFGSTEFHVLRPKEKVTSNFIFQILSLSDFRKTAEKKMTGSAGQKRVPKNFLETFEVSIPPLSLQTQFATRIEKIEGQKELIKQGIAQTQQLIDYTMDKYFG